MWKKERKKQKTKSGERGEWENCKDDEKRAENDKISNLSNICGE